MYFSDKIQLITQASTPDSIGGMDTADETIRAVFGDIQSVGGKEQADAARMGIRPEARAVIHADDYRGESIVMARGKRYGVYRTYQASGTVELYLEAKAGA